MRQKSLLLFLLLLLLSLSVLLPRATRAYDRIRVACVGDSITYGFGLTNPTSNSYPTQLDELLGYDYSVRNFGHHGTTMLKSTNKSYWNTSEYTDSTNWDPDIVVIMLGTNDANPQNWTSSNKRHFGNDYEDMISHYANLPSHPKVFISLPPPIYKKSSQLKSNLRNAVVPQIVQVAEETGTPVINVYDAMSNHSEWFQPDGIHPNFQGASFIANLVYANLIHAKVAQ